MDWKKKKKPIISNLNKSIENREKILENIDYSQFSLYEIGDQMNDELSRLYSMRNLLQNDDIHIQLNPATEGSIDSIAYFSASDVQNTEQLVAGMDTVQTDIDLLKRTVKISMGTAIPSMTSGIVLMTEHMEPRSHVYQYTEILKDPTPRDRRNELSAKLSVINSRLPKKLEGAWQTLQDHSKVDRFLQAASSIRDLISDFLKTLAPDDNVKSMKWFQPETQTGKPSQKQRARYTMLGSNLELEDEELIPIYTMSEGIRDTYNHLSKIAHLRDYDVELQTLTENLIDQCQSYLLKIIKIRDSYFKS